MPDWRDALLIEPTGNHSDGLDVSSAVTLTVPDGAHTLMMQALTQNVRFTVDGTTPEATKGFQLKAGDPPIILGFIGTPVVKVIEETTTADLQIQWGK
jgi:hypothetical protein